MFSVYAIWHNLMKSSSPYSIKKQLALALSIILGMLTLVSFFFSFQAAQHEVEEIYDAKLGQYAKLLHLFSSGIQEQSQAREQFEKTYSQWMQMLQTEQPNNQQLQLGHPYEMNILFQLYQKEALIWSSLPDIKAYTPLPSLGYHSLYFQEEEWRAFVFQSPDNPDLTVLVAERQSIREEIMEEIALSTTLPQIVLLPLLVLVIVMLVYRYFQPLHILKHAIAQRNAYHLDKIHIAQKTAELTPLVDALNSLLQALEVARSREKKFMQMAAHELKTPLTILRLNVENAVAAIDEPAELKKQLHAITRSIERTDRIMVQLLLLAKVESLPRIIKETFALSPVLQQLLIEIAPIARKNEQELELKMDANHWIHGDKTLLEVVFRNLLDNALRYSGANSHITVETHVVNQMVQIHFSDNGKPIPDNIRARLFEPFYRGHTARGDGAGLGMSIIQYIARLHGGSIELLNAATSPHHNVFVVTLPLAALAEHD